MVETQTTAVLDHLKALKKKSEWVVITCCFLSFIAGLGYCTSGGVYLFTLVDSWAGSWNILLIAFLECVLGKF